MQIGPEVTDLATEFWDYSLNVYSHQPMQDQLLDWQNNAGANVNICLLCLWSGNQGRLLHRTDLARAEEGLAAWNRAVTRPLRELRQRLTVGWPVLPSAAHNTRQQILAAELEAEKTEQSILIAVLAPWTIEPNAAQARRTGFANLETYLGSATAAPAASMASIWVSE